MLFDESQGQQHPTTEMANNAFFVVFEAQATTQDRRWTNAEARDVGGFVLIGKKSGKVSTVSQ